MWLSAYVAAGLAGLVVVVTLAARSSDVTGSRTRVVWFKICPVVLTYVGGSAPRRQRRARDTDLSL